MKFFEQAFLVFIFSLLFLPLNATQWIKTYAVESYLGPEIYYVHRTKEAGVEQSGILYGIRLGYERIQRYKLYWGADFLWAKGTLDGKAPDSRLKSVLTDTNVEARLGYTFQSKYWRCASFTPYIGGGCFWENNFYQHPSPLPIHFKNHFSYIPVGFLSQIFITPQCSIGLNIKVRYLLDAYVDVSHDPYHDGVIQHYEKKLQYRVELPFTYFICWDKCDSLAIGVVSFYEYRPYGHLANFPFDFLETNLELCGAIFKILYVF